jgi:hypothetical protein
VHSDQIFERLKKDNLKPAVRNTALSLTCDGREYMPVGEDGAGSKKETRSENFEVGCPRVFHNLGMAPGRLLFFCRYRAHLRSALLVTNRANRLLHSCDNFWGEQRVVGFQMGARSFHSEGRVRRDQGCLPASCASSRARTHGALNGNATPTTPPMIS